MTPAARIAAAIEILDRILEGAPAEPALTGWARGHRFAGSKDRAALRDLVFDALRCRRSYAALGGGETGRGLMIGALRAAGEDPAQMFSGARYAPAPLSAAEAALPTEVGAPPAVRLDCPDWLVPLLQRSLGNRTEPVLQLLRQRAPVFLRVNLRKASRDAAQRDLAADGIAAEPHALSPTALQVIEGARRIRTSQAFATGAVELQDAASQAVSDLVPLVDGQRMLDFCAGGGGKTLAVAARVDGRFWAHDAEPARMTDLPVRAARAGVRVKRLDTAALAQAGPFDLVLVDAPCSGSGSWRRDPQGKWTLTQARLDELCRLQSRILDQAAAHVAPGGHLVYMTCSLLAEENRLQIDGFLRRNPDWCPNVSHALTPLDGGDGFFFSDLTRVTSRNNF